VFRSTRRLLCDAVSNIAFHRFALTIRITLVALSRAPKNVDRFSGHPVCARDVIEGVRAAIYLSSARLRALQRCRGSPCSAHTAIRIRDYGNIPVRSDTRATTSRMRAAGARAHTPGIIVSRGLVEIQRLPTGGSVRGRFARCSTINFRVLLPEITSSPAKRGNSDSGTRFHRGAATAAALYATHARPQLAIIMLLRTRRGRLIIMRFKRCPDSSHRLSHAAKERKRTPPAAC